MSRVFFLGIAGLIYPGAVLLNAFAEVLHDGCSTRGRVMLFVDELAWWTIIGHGTAIPSSIGSSLQS